MKLNELIHKSISENKFVQVLRFILIGGFTALLDFATLFVLTDYLAVNYLLSAAIGFVLGSSINYLLSIKWVFFRGKFNSYTTEFGVFIFFTLLGLLLNQVIMYVGTSIFLLLYLYSKLIALILVTIFNFITKKYIVFVK